MEDYYFNPPDLRKEEILSLFLAGQAFREDNFSYKEELATALAKIINSLPKSIKNVLTDTEEKIFFQHNHSVDLSAYKETIQKIEKAIGEQRSIEMFYYSLGSNKKNSRRADTFQKHQIN